MDTSAPTKCLEDGLVLPDDVMHLIFSKLEFLDKVNSCTVCVEWNQLLKAGGAAAKHWIVKYRVPRKDVTDFSSSSRPVSRTRSALIGRWLARRAAAIKCVDLEVAFWDLHTRLGAPYNLQEFCETQTFLESQLPLLAGALSGQVNVLEVTFTGGSPFASPLPSSPQFLSIFCPLVKKLTLFRMEVPITADQFAAICHMSNLEELSISGVGGGQDGLQEMTSDISKLVNLHSLELRFNHALESIPDAFSCLQKLERILIGENPNIEVCAGLGKMANLRGLCIGVCHNLQFPRKLEGLESLSYLQIVDCSLPAIPRAFSSLSALETLCLGYNKFALNDPQWWPTSLSRLTQLVALSLCSCGIEILPAHVSALVGLKDLGVGNNFLSSLPSELSCLRNLEDLDLEGNCLPDVPVSVLSRLTALKEVNLHRQRQLEGHLFFGVTGPLLPILHPGIVRIRLDQEHPWDMMSLIHLGGAMAAVANRRPMPDLIF